jgi:hypothetical protein
MCLKTVAFEGCLPEPEYTFLFSFVDGASQTFLNQSLIVVRSWFALLRASSNSESGICTVVFIHRYV